jgi:ferredoxin-fold anticodon binding domain-containing protein
MAQLSPFAHEPREIQRPERKRYEFKTSDGTLTRTMDSLKEQLAKVEALALLSEQNQRTLEQRQQRLDAKVAELSVAVANDRQDMNNLHKEVCAFVGPYVCDLAGC